MGTIVPHVERSSRPNAAGVAARATEPSTPRGLFAGLATLDIVQLVERLPAPNEKVAALDFCVAAGGPATNAAVAFAHCGGEAVLATALPEHDLVAALGRDLEACGVELAVCAAYPGAPVTASILVTRASGDRAVVSPSGAATHANPDPTVLPSLDGIGAVLIDGYFRSLGLGVAARARERGIPVVLDAGSHKFYTDDVVRACDIAVVSDDFTPPGTDGSADAVFAYLASLGVARAVITRGAGPIAYRTPAGEGVVEVAPVPVADTLGAGDFFHGALVWRLASLGLDDKRLPDDLAFASRVAGASLGTFGTRAWLGSR